MAAAGGVAAPGALGAAAPPLDAAAEKRLKGLQKKLKRIEELKRKRAEGDPETLRLLSSDPEVRQKLGSEQEVREQIAALESGVPPECGDRGRELSILEQLDDALSIQSHVAMLLGPSEKKFRELHKKLREIEKLMRKGTLDKLQEEKVQKAPDLLEEFRPLRSIAMEMDYDEKDILELKAKRELASKSVTEAAAAASAAHANAAAVARPAAVAAVVPPRIGIDVGGVLNKHLNDDHSEEDWDTKTDSAAPGAMEGLRKCVNKFGAANVFIVSKCSGRMREKTERWLFHTMDICRNASVERSNVYFCRDRFGLYGKGVIAGSVQLSHFVDDRDDCLWSVYEDQAGNAKASVDRHQGKLFHMARGGAGRKPQPKEWQRDERPRGVVVPVCSWAEVLRELGIG